MPKLCRQVERWGLGGVSLVVTVLFPKRLCVVFSHDTDSARLFQTYAIEAEERGTVFGTIVIDQDQAREDRCQRARRRCFRCRDRWTRAIRRVGEFCSARCSAEEVWYRQAPISRKEPQYSSYFFTIRSSPRVAFGVSPKSQQGELVCATLTGQRLGGPLIVWIQRKRCTALRVGSCLSADYVVPGVSRKFPSCRRRGRGTAPPAES